MSSDLIYVTMQRGWSTSVSRDLDLCINVIRTLDGYIHHMDLGKHATCCGTCIWENMQRVVVPVFDLPHYNDCY